MGYLTLAGLDATIKEANVAGAHIFRRPTVELLDRRMGIFVAPVDRERFNAAIAAALESADATSLELGIEVERDVLGRELPRRTVDVELLLSGSRGRTEVRAILVDATERKLLEETARAAAKMQAIGRLTAGIAHDFNNLLSVVLVHAEFATEAAGENDSVRAELSQMTQTIERAVRLTRKLLAFDRARPMNLSCVDLNACITLDQKLLRRTLGPEIELTLELTNDTLYVEADVAQLDQVIVNLAMNARDATPMGGEFIITTKLEGDEVVLTARDTGLGMDKRTLARIFEPFFTTKSAEHGSGFGLATVFNIVEQFHGSITVQSERGSGATFEIRLPRSMREPSARAPSSPEVGAGREATGTILLVDDDAAVRRVARRVLTSAGYKVIEATGGADALAIHKNRAQEIDLVVTDVVMPLMNGLELAERLERDAPGLQIVFMSGYASAALGPDRVIDPTRWLEKPFTAAALRACVRAVLAAGAAARPPPA